MRRIAAVLLVLVLAGCSSPAAPTRAPAPAPSIATTVRVSDRIRDLTVSSPAVGAQVRVRLILPAGFDPAGPARYPVLYLLHGADDSYLAWTRSTDVEELVADSGVLVAMPDGGKSGFYSDWLRGPKWETFHTVELWQLLRDQYRASDVRAVAGLSMGGLGALDYAARHPGAFRAAAAFSPIAQTREPGTSQANVDLVRTVGADPDDLWGDPINNSGVWADHDPYEQAAGLKGVPLFISVGNGMPGPLDPPGATTDDTEAYLHDQTAELAGHLKTLGIAATIDDYGPGTHTWPYWERELHRAWPMLKDALLR